MSQSGPPAAKPAASSPDALRIVLFGLPAAGKSSLLGALAQSAQSQEHLFNGRLIDLTNGLAELRKQLYEQRGRRTVEEVAPYPVDFEPFASDGRALIAHEHLGAILVDCDGRVANDLLARNESLDENSREGTLAREVIQADTLLLAVDAADTLPQVDANFAEFDRFLRLLEQDRGERIEVGGLPVFLVLTKCDLLAMPGDSAGAWMERIEERKREVSELFRNFLARRPGEGGSPPFGRLDLNVWATAVKRPALANSPAKDREPFGVAELFRQCLEQAANFRARGHHSRRRLAWTVGGVGGLAATMLALMIGLATTNRETPSGDLRAKVEEIRSAEDSTPAARLRGSPLELRRRLADFVSLREDAAFASLPSADRDFVRDRIGELEEYIAYYDKLRLVPRPADIASTEKLRALASELQTLAPPREEWTQTEAGQLHARYLTEAEALAKAVTRAKGWYDEVIDKGRDLWVFARYQPTPEAPAINWRGWYDEVARLLDAASKPLSIDNEPIPGTSLTYATAFRFDQVLETRGEWEGVKDKLQRVLDVSAALSLVVDAKGRPALLVIPRPPDFSLDRARTRLKELQEAYPRYRTEFVLAGLPDAIVPEIRQAARANYDFLLDPAREAVLQQLRKADTGDEETPARWSRVGDWLAAGPEELTAWRALALLLAQLNDARAGDPVTELAIFLKKTTFPIEIKQLTLEIPFRYPDVKPQAGANLDVYHPATTPEGPAIACSPAGEGQRDDARKMTVYKFRPRERHSLTYHPGEALWATLPLRQNQALTWTRGHSTVYQFERMLRPPRLHGANEQASEGTLAEGIELVVTPADGVPRVPDLMPVVRLTK